MLKIKSINIILLTTILFGFSSCEKYFGDINVDPNNPLEVPLEFILPPIQAEIAYAVGGDMARYTSIYTQHIDGIARQFDSFQQYNISSSNMNSIAYLLYSGALTDLKELNKAAVASEFNHYNGIGKVLEAYTIMLLTDIWGDLPYSEAIQGTDQLQPKFDTQQSLYDAIFSLLDEAEALFDLDGGAKVPGDDDLIYSGDIGMWGDFAKALRARAYIHLGAVDNGNYSKALTEITNSFQSVGGQAAFKFGTTSSSEAPWAQYIDERDDADVGANYVLLLQSLTDPREAVYGAAIENGVPHPVFVSDQSLPLLSYTELKFMEAEAEMKTNGATSAHQPYLDAIEASFADANLSAEYGTYVSQSIVDPGAANLTMEHIMTQKYIALFTNPEVYNDYRRTGFPVLTPNTGPNVPVRLPYPEDMNEYNPNTPSIDQYTSTVWWDM